jgi:hypothetical protein
MCRGKDTIRHDGRQNEKMAGVSTLDAIAYAYIYRR